jgi:hypothetical protein
MAALLLFPFPACCLGSRSFLGLGHHVGAGGGKREQEEEAGARERRRRRRGGVMRAVLRAVFGARKGSISFCTPVIILQGFCKLVRWRALKNPPRRIDRSHFRWAGSAQRSRQCQIPGPYPRPLKGRVSSLFYAWQCQPFKGTAGSRYE